MERNRVLITFCLDVRKLCVACRKQFGMTIIEIIVGCAMLMVLLSGSMPMMRAIATQQRAPERRTLALQSIQAVSEQLANLPWAMLNQQAADNVALPEIVRPSLPGAKLTATVADEQLPVAAKKLLVEIRWNAPNGQPTGPLRLATWVFQSESNQSETDLQDRGSNSDEATN